MTLSLPFILASQSPRRKRLLEQIGLTFTVHAADLDETFDPEAGPADIVQSLALDKADAIAQAHPDALVLGADTVVVFEGDILGKPADADEAHAMLRRLSGQTHTVYTGIALIHGEAQRAATRVEATDVTFGNLSDQEIADYVASGSPMDKAGAYGIQDDLGACFVARIEGDYYNVVGLPLHRLYRLLHDRFGDLLL
ncbi:MAG: Maf family protein [Rhodothermales bacterium]